MKVLVGDCRGHKQIAILKEHGWGRMFALVKPTPFTGEPWGFDNLAYVYFTQGKSFDSDAYRRRLDTAKKIEKVPHIAVAPDIVAGGRASLDFSWNWMSGRELPDNWPWYLAVQDGMTQNDVREIIRGGFAGLFLGGTDKFKQRTAWKWAELAHEFGLKFHYGRAGTLRKLEHAKRIQADSLDSTFPLWTKERFATFIAQFYDNRQGVLNHENNLHHSSASCLPT